MLVNSRGQESAVFEVLIAVIVMSFVIAFGMNAVDQMNKQACISQVNDSLEKMNLAITAVANGSSPGVDIAFAVPTCIDYRNEKVTIYTSDNPETCKDPCSRGDLCTILQYQSPEQILKKCLRISYVTNFGRQFCNELPGYSSLDLMNLPNIPAGNYFISKSPQNEDFPTICAYRRND